jgi:thiamine-phosphate pyrophosphorylase
LLVAAADRVDYATLSPIWATASKPGYGPALGIEGLAKAVVAVPELPVYALGGVMPGRASACIEAGAAGVAVMGAVMGAPDPAAVVRVLLAELGETGRR